MKHLELIELLYKHRELIDSAFKGEALENLPTELTDDAAIFQKVAKKYELSDTYTQFANSILKRVDANYTFGDYNEEIKLLVRLKSDYIETKERLLLLRIKQLVKTLYKKIEQRDILINARINDIVNDNDLTIEQIIKDATDIDRRVTELIDAHSQNLKFLGKELRGLDEELDDTLIDIGLDMLTFTDNIYVYNARLSDFILRTQRRKKQNKKLSSLTNKILKEQDSELRSLILSHTQLYHHTLREKKSTSVKYLPSPIELSKTSFLNALEDLLKIKKVQRKTEARKPYEVAKTVELKVIKIEIIKKDLLQDKPNDIYCYILKHQEIQKFKDDQLDTSYAFKTYLTIMQESRENIIFEDDFNKNHIRIAKWI